jgi:hypothetical protein
MKKLAMPIDTMDTSYNACLENIVNDDVRKKYESSRLSLVALANNYIELTTNEKIVLLTPHEKSKNINPKIAGEITRDELLYLYNYYMVKRKSGRKVYDRIMAAAKEECPFCGGIGHVKNLDHYLPKAFFSQFSVFPVNLIPSCRDCNMDGKGSGFAIEAKDQLIHPYLDKDIFFNEQWVFARVIDGSSLEAVIEYEVVPPEHWTDVEKSRVIKHFKEFGLAKRYSIEAGRELSGLLDQRKSSLDKLGAEFFKETVITPISDSDKLFINHWKRVMYNALEKNVDFYQC